MSVVNVKDYANTIFDLYLARCLITQCQETAERASEPTIKHSTKELIEEHEIALFSLAESGMPQSDVVSFRDSLVSAVELAERAYKNSGRVTGVSTGFADLDKLLGGLHPTDLVILAGRPSMGKTALATNIAMNAAIRYLETQGEEGAAVGFFLWKWLMHKLLLASCRIWLRFRAMQFARETLEPGILNALPK